MWRGCGWRPVDVHLWQLHEAEGNFKEKYDRSNRDAVSYTHLDVYKRQQSIYRFKDGGRREYAEFYAKESARLYGDWIKRKDIQAIIPIPIHRHKRYKRGYNQAEIYAKELGKQDVYKRQI